MKKHFIILALLFALCAGANGQIRIHVLSATVKSKTIESAQVSIQKDGYATATGFTDPHGTVFLKPPFKDDENCSLIIQKEGYSTLVVKGPCNGLSYAISPIMDNMDEIRIVLTWHEFPKDLDSHLWYGNQHIYHGSPQGHMAYLEVDNANSYGPETIKIQNKEFGTEYIYGVYDYSDSGDINNTNLTHSGARVFVYRGEKLEKAYDAPKNKTGNFWAVFSITHEGHFKEIGEVTVIPTPPKELPFRKPEVINKTEALKWNNQGVIEHSMGNYTNAIQHYLKAINLNPEDGQVYSNMGLTYDKFNLKREAILANIRAIQLASGLNAHLTRAGSYYNIGMIYENERQYQNAKTFFEEAKKHNDIPIYDIAIQRINDLLSD